MSDCYTGTNVPELQTEACDGLYTSSDCVKNPNAIIYLNLLANSSSTEIFNALVLALMRKDEQIQELQDQIDAL